MNTEREDFDSSDNEEGFQEDEMNEFRIIPNQQTPKVVQEIMSVEYIEKHNDILNEFLEFVKYKYNAVGLAANQCNLNKERFNQRIFAIRNLKDYTWRLIIDPVILEYIGMKEPKLEGCLTWYGKSILADRFRAVKVSYYDIDGGFHRDEIYNGFEAQIWQHEINHLNGIEEQVVNNDYKLPVVKIMRNEKCPCGSGKKYKLCCLKYE
jgi:peptide deformylase